MADVAAMDIVIGADVSKAIQGLEGLSTELADLSKTGVTSVNQLSRAMDTLRTAAAKTTDVGALAKYNQALEKLAGESTRLKNVGLGEELKKIKPGASQATQALTDLGRVAQDAPFGFIGIQNNIGPLIDSFGRLSAESKKTGTSLLSSLGAALSGPAGLGIAVSLVTAALTFAQTGFSAWTQGFSAGAKAVDEVTKANEDYAKSIKDIDKSVVESSQKQIVQLEILSKVAQDTSAAMNVRLDATKKLQELSPAVLGSLSKEQILYGDLTEAIKKATEALINQALAQAETDKAVKAGAKLFTIIEKRKIAQIEYNAALADYKKIQGTIQPREVFEFAEKQVRDTAAALGILNTQFFETDLELATFKGHAENFTKLGAGATNVEKIMSKLTEKIDELNKKAQATGASFKDEKISAWKTALDDLIKAGLSPASAEIQNLVKNIRDSGGSFEKIGKVDHKKIKDAADVISNLTEELRALNVEQTEVGGDMRQKMISAIDLAVTALIKMGIAGTDPRIQNLLKTEKDITQTLNHQKEILESLVNLRPKIDLKFEQPKDLKDIKLDRQFIPVLEVQIKPVMDKEALKALKWKVMGEQAAKDFNKAFQALIKQAIEDISAEIGKTLGNLFTGQKDAFAGLFDALAGVLEQLGKIAITTGVGVLAIKTSLKTLNPFVAIAAGIALVALSQIARNSIKQTAMAEGGIVTGPTSALIGEAGPEVVFPLDRLREFIQPNNAQVVVLETRVRGNDIWLSQSRTNERRGRTY